MLDDIEALVGHYGAVPPPWVVHNEHPYSICWRMGDGESHLMWSAWWSQQRLAEDQRIDYFRRWPPPHCWLPFLIEAIWEVDVGAGDEVLAPYFVRTENLGFGSRHEYEADLNDPKWLEDDERAD